MRSTKLSVTSKLSAEHETPPITNVLLAAVAVKLSKAQKEVITKLQASEIIHYMNGYDAKCFYSNGAKTISWATIFKLENYGLVERTNKRIELTEHGRSYCC